MFPSPEEVPNFGLKVQNFGESYYRDHLVACRAQLNGVDAPTPEETDQHMEGIQARALKL